MDTFAALAEPTRRDILIMLVNSGELSASEIYNKFTVSAPAISQHLKVLREAKLVDMEKRAQQRIYTVNPAGMYELETWIKNFTKRMDERFSRLDKVLEAEKNRMTKKSEGGDYNGRKKSKDYSRRRKARDLD